MKLNTVIALSLSFVALSATSLSLVAETQPILSKQPLMLVAAQSHHGEGTVTAIDKKGKKVEFDHGPIKSIGWMGMKMFFDVDDRELLDEIEIGDKVEFEFIKTRDGRFVVTDLETQG